MVDGCICTMYIIALPDVCIHHTDAVAITEQIYGHTIGPIVWDDVQCDGTESNLTECRRSEVRVHNCELNQGVAVSCPGKRDIYIYIIH